ncbi:DNA/RNA nuclease SfsA [Candidatus Bathyarchaeota archaeon]|nr:DNA/RNA nuclease SfsA [Candidatus Bathyarchaeota archaeon]
MFILRAALMLLLPVDFKVIQGRFISRLNRFMALVEVGGKNVYAHLPNSGRLTTTLYPGVKLYLREPRRYRVRKSIYSIFASLHSNNVTIIVDSQFSNLLVKRAIEMGLINELAGYRIIKENVRPEASNAKLDFLLTNNADAPYYLEVKSVTHVVDDVALFPDAPTLRGRRHLLEMLKLLKSGFKAGLIFSVQRPDATHVKPNYDVDPEFASLLKASVEEGLKVFTLRAVFDPKRSVLTVWPNDPHFIF